MEQDRKVRGQEQVGALAHRAWVVDEVEGVVEEWDQEEIVSALPAEQRCLINEEFPVFN